MKIETKVKKEVFLFKIFTVKVLNGWMHSVFFKFSNLSFYILLIVFLFFLAATFCHYSNKLNLVYSFFYVGLTYLYFFVLLNLNISSISTTYGYYFIIFLSYLLHLQSYFV